MTELLIKGTVDTLKMVIISLVLSYALGLLLGSLLVLTKPGGLMQNRKVYVVISSIIDVLRSIPFIILMVLIIPLTRFVTGTSIGVAGTIVPLVFSASPFVGRMIEQSFLEVDPLTINMAKVFGASPFRILIDVYLKESIPSILRGIPIVAIAIIGYSAMAGATGGGGLGDIAIRYGYYNYNQEVMLITIIIILLIVEVFQISFNMMSKIIDKRK